MTIKVTKTALILGLFMLIFAGCNQSSKTKVSKGTTSEGQEASVEVEVFDVMKLKDQIVEIIQNSPKTDEIADLLINAGASYILDITVPTEDAEKFMSTSQMSLGLGMFAFDLQYAQIYNRADKIGQIIEIEKNIIDQLGLTSELSSSENFAERIRENAENKDSVDYLVAMVMNYAHSQFASGDHPGVYALAFIGANVEALHVLSQLTLLAADNTELLKVMSAQKERVKSVFSLMELMSGDEKVKLYYNDMVPVAKFFEEHSSITEKELNTIVPMIEKIKRNML